MHLKKINFSLLVVCLFMSFSLIKAQMSPEAKIGKDYFEGNKKFINGGPGCVSCHNLNNKYNISGELISKDLTNVYKRMGEGITVFLGSPKDPEMRASYKNNLLTENEKSSLTAFLKYVDEDSANKIVYNVFTYKIVGVVITLLIILVLIWIKRK